MQSPGNISASALTVLALLSGFALHTARAHPKGNSVRESRDWSVYGGSPEYLHYSPLAQINRSNVKQLQVSWTYDTGEQGGLETSPLMVDGVLYGITPTQKIFAVDAATGKRSGNSTPGSKACNQTVG